MKILIKTIIILIAISGPSFAFGQYKLILSEIQIKSESMNSFEKFADKQANIASDLPISVAIYKDEHITYYTCFVLTERGKKFRLMNQDFVQYNGNKFKGDRQVLKFKKSEATRGRIPGISEQTITFNDELGRMINVIYRFELILD